MDIPQLDLVHRRQFLLGPRSFAVTSDWQTFDVPGGLVLSAHPDLEINSCPTPNGLLFGIGILLDPFRPADTSAEVVRRLAAGKTTAADLIAATTGVGGRWALLYVSPGESVLFTDPLGSRQVYYYTDDGAIWCGSQPEIIHAATPLRSTEDTLLLEFISSPEFLESEGAMYGEGTPYASCFHLLPNHYLNLTTAQSIRFFPDGPLPTPTAAEAVPLAARLLRGTFDAMARRSDLMLPITAGWDTRLLLAAARDHVTTMYCYVDQMGVLGRRNPDVRVPERLAERLGCDFTVEDSRENPPPWFIELLQKNITGARSLPKTRSIYAKLKRGEHRINMNGNGAEICRTNEAEPRPPASPYISAQLLLERLAERYCADPPGALAVREVSHWLSTLTDRMYDYHPFDLIYWEQRMGNWGGFYPAEQDIAVEEISPYNNRLLITTLLSFPLELRRTPDCSLQREVIEHLWPDVLSEPLNPDTLLPPVLRQTVRIPKRIVRNSLPKPVVKRLRNLKQKMQQVR